MAVLCAAIVGAVLFYSRLSPNNHLGLSPSPGDKGIQNQFAVPDNVAGHPQALIATRMPPGAGAASPPSVARSPIENSPIVGAWRNSAPALSLTPNDYDTVTAWLQELLSHPHRPMSRESLDGFTESVTAFSKANSGITSTQQGSLETANLLRYCMSQAFSPDLNDAAQAAAATDYQKLATTLLASVRARIENGIPSDKRADWKLDLDRVFSEASSRMLKRVLQLNVDFLYPAFKRALPIRAEDRACGEILNSDWIPKYGATVERMQTRDEAFKEMLERFPVMFDIYFTFCLTTQQIGLDQGFQAYWHDYMITSTSNAGGWPVCISVRKTGATVAASGPR